MEALGEFRHFVEERRVHHFDGETWSVAGYASYQATEKLSFHFRGEYLRDRGEQKFFSFVNSDTSGDVTFGSTNPDRGLALTATAQYDLWKNVISRLELRWDHSLSGEQAWGKAHTTEVVPGFFEESGSLRNEFMLAANIIYKF